MKNSTYAIIHNPRNLVFKHEVWVKGIGIGQDAQGYRVDTEVKRKVKAFINNKAAQDFIEYQQNVEKFVGA